MRHTFGPFFAFVNLQVPVSTCKYLQVLRDTCNLAGALATREYSTREYSTREYSTREYSTREYSTREYSTREYSTREYSTREYELLVGTSLHECEFPFGN